MVLRKGRALRACGITFRRGIAAEPVRYAVDGLAVAQSTQDIFPKIGADQSGKDLVAGSLPMAQLLDFGAQIFLGLTNRNLVDAVDFLGFAATAGLATVALKLKPLAYSIARM